MRNVRGLIALTFSILLAFIAAMAAYRHMNRPPPAIPTVAAAEPVKTAPPAKRFSQRIETGMRAVTLVVDDMTDTVGELAPGDQVDVLAVTPIPGETDGRVSRLLLSGARIMDVESHAKSRGGHAHAFKVTLTVTPGEAAAIASADPSAAIRLIARNPGDDLRETQPPTAFAADRGIQVYASQQRDMTRLIAPGMRAITLEVK
ncbi:MAG: hypothetical protein HKP58_08690, partial [Desulfatitalea sp.]|nr:hypothetical protein [Desulfatitalea sp.]NNK00475.1 hypothetical protein [Desulfatitalea sp.]